VRLIAAVGVRLVVVRAVVVRFEAVDVLVQSLNMVVVRLLRLADVCLVAEDRHAVLAQ
jgi:hypothetical protein